MNDKPPLGFTLIRSSIPAKGEIGLHLAGTTGTAYMSRDDARRLASALNDFAGGDGSDVD